MYSSFSLDLGELRSSSAIEVKRKKQELICYHYLEQSQLQHFFTRNAMLKQEYKTLTSYHYISHSNDRTSKKNPLLTSHIFTNCAMSHMECKIVYYSPGFPCTCISRGITSALLIINTWSRSLFTKEKIQKVCWEPWI